MNKSVIKIGEIICDNCVYRYSRHNWDDPNGKYYWNINDLPCYSCDNVKRVPRIKNNFISMEIFLGKDVVAKMCGCWYLGYIGYYEIHGHIFEIKDFIFDSISEVEDIDKYISLKKFMEKYGIDTKFRIDLLKQFEVDRIYLKEED